MKKKIFFVSVSFLFIFASYSCADKNSCEIKYSISDAAIADSFKDTLRSTGIHYLETKDGIICVSKKDMEHSRAVYDETLERLIPPKYSRPVDINIAQRVTDALRKKGVQVKTYQLDHAIIIVWEETHDAYVRDVIETETDKYMNEMQKKFEERGENNGHPPIRKLEDTHLLTVRID